MRYLLLRFHSQHGSEPVCALNGIAAYGRSAVEELEDQLALGEEAGADGDDGVGAPNGEAEAEALLQLEAAAAGVEAVAVQHEAARAVDPPPVLPQELQQQQQQQQEQQELVGSEATPGVAAAPPGSDTQQLEQASRAEADADAGGAPLGEQQQEQQVEGAAGAGQTLPIEPARDLAAYPRDPLAPGESAAAAVPAVAAVVAPSSDTASSSAATAGMQQPVAADSTAAAFNDSYAVNSGAAIDTALCGAIANGSGSSSTGNASTPSVPGQANSSSPAGPEPQCLASLGSIPMAALAADGAAPLT